MKMDQIAPEKTQLLSNFIIPLTPSSIRENTCFTQTFHQSKGVYLSSKKSKYCQKSEFFNEKNIDSYDDSLKLESFSIIEELGVGAFGIVYKAFNDEWDEYLALKIISLPRNIESELKQFLTQQIFLEKFLLEQINLLNDCHLIKFYSIFKDNSNPNEEKIVIAMENGTGNMNDILFYRKSYSQKEIAYIIHYLSEALHNCETRFIANRDIKPENLIIIKDKNNEFYYKIADFGIGCQLSAEERTILISECPGFTQLYAAPELLNSNNNNYYSPFKSDVYSLGITILKMMGLSSDEIRKLKRDLETNALTECIKKGYEKIWSPLRKMISLDPNERPSFAEIHKIFKNIPKIKPYEKDYFKKLEEKIDNLSSEQKLIKCERMFYLYEKINDLEKTIHYGNLCLNLTSKLKGSESYTTAYWYFVLGAIFQEQENYSDAIKFYKKSYEIVFENLNKFCGLTANIFNNIALIYREQGKYSLAFKLIEKSLIIRKTLFGIHDIDYADSLNNLASIYQKFNLKKALKLYEKAYLISIKKRGEFDYVTLIYMNNIAETNRKLGNLNESLLINKRCSKQKETHLQNQDLSLSKSYNNIGLVYFLKKKYDKALIFLEKSIQIKEKFLKESHFSLANSYFNVGVIYDHLEDNEQAILHYKKVFLTWKKIYGKKSIFVTTISNKIVRVLEKKHRSLQKNN